MPRSDEFSAILDHEVPHRTEFVRGKIGGLSERDGFQPELSEGAVAPHVNVRGFVAFVTEEEEAVRTDAKDRRQSPLTISSSAASAASPLQRVVRRRFRLRFEISRVPHEAPVS